ncbi:MAG: glycerophosphodiester phosphodiesterase [Nocardioidaceae bacterium]|nr:glycerophosphodiester phosphodiesterase [Nocardioidaceae bacterium]
MTRPRTGFRFLDAGREEGAVLAFAHRGGARHPDLVGLENTLTAFEHAVRLGYTYLETDVHATTDGVLLAFHDTVLDRVTDSTGSIAGLAYDVLADARIGGSEAIPRMADLLEHFPRARFNIDLKADAAVPLLAALVDRTRSHDRVCIGSFSDRRLREFRRRVNRPVATSYGPVGVGLSRLVPGTLAERVLQGRGAALQVPHRLRGVTVVNRRFVERAHAAGRPVHVWTVDDRAEMEELLDLGVDGLMTDRTDVLRDVLVGRGQWTGATA